MSPSCVSFFKECTMARELAASNPGKRELYKSSYSLMWARPKRAWLGPEEVKQSKTYIKIYKEKKRDELFVAFVDCDKQNQDKESLRG